jgi:hypothetical protein
LVRGKRVNHDWNGTLENKFEEEGRERPARGFRSTGWKLEIHHNYYYPIIFYWDEEAIP